MRWLLSLVLVFIAPGELRAATLDVAVMPGKTASLRVVRSLLDGSVKRPVMVHQVTLPEGTMLRLDPNKPLLYRWYLSEENKIIQSSMPYFEAQVLSLPGLAEKTYVQILEVDTAKIIAALFRDELPPGVEKINYPFLWDAHNPQGTWAYSLQRAFREAPNRWLLRTPPRDIRDFCPRFEGLGAKERELFWIAFLNLVVRYESAYVPLTASDEGRYDPGNKGIISSGLTQISLASSRAACYQERGCALVRKQEELFVPDRNLRCSVGIMSCLAESGNCLSCKRSSGWQGIARYWSTLRDPYEVNCPTCPGGKITIGKKPAILGHLKTTAAFCF
jgi:hypothetical protein